MNHDAVCESMRRSLKKKIKIKKKSDKAHNRIKEIIKLLY